MVVDMPLGMRHVAGAGRRNPSGPRLGDLGQETAMVNHPRRRPHFAASEIVTGNPILESLGVSSAEIQAHDPAEVDVLIYVDGVRNDGLPCFQGSLKSSDRQEFEGFYALDGRGGIIGSCIAAPHTVTKAGALRVLAQAFIGRNPKAGEIAAVGEMLRAKSRVVFSPRRHGRR
jgi:hypothetical protein